MHLVRKSVRIIKMSIGTSKLPCLLVHQFHKFLYRAGGVFGESQGHFICRLEHNGHHCLLHGEFLSGICINTGTVADGDTVSGAFGHDEFSVHIQMFTGQKSRHDLCNAGRILDLVRIF